MHRWRKGSEPWASPLSRRLGVAPDRVALLAHLADLVPVKRFCRDFVSPSLRRSVEELSFY